MMKERERTLTVRLNEKELAQLHALAEADDVPMGQMLRRWLAERWTARFGNATPPATTTKFGSAIDPTK